MFTTKMKYHYKDLDGTQKIHEAATHYFSAGSEELNNEVCLVNTCGDYTEFEGVPDEIDKWLNQIGIDFTHFPNLTRLWGETRSEYALTLRYELAHERDSVRYHDYPVILPYDEQLRLLMEAAVKIAKAIPYAVVRLTEMGACEDQHDLEIAFPYPCEPEKIFAGRDILESQFDYVWDIGREPREHSRDASLASNIPPKEFINQIQKDSPDVTTYNPEEISLAERLRETIGDENLLCSFSGQFAEAYASDEESPSRVYKRIFEQYIKGSHEVRYIINDVFISLCGYGIETLLNRAADEDV